MRNPTHPAAPGGASRRHVRQISGGALALLIGLAAMNAEAIAKKTPAPPEIPSPPPASKVHRCIQAGGQVLYAQRPCAGAREDEGAGTATLMQAGDARTQAQFKQGQDVHKREQRLAQSMQRDRRKAERQAANRKAISLGPSSDERKLSKARQSRSLETSLSASSKRKSDKLGKRNEFVARVPKAQAAQGGSLNTGGQATSSAGLPAKH